MESGDWMNTLAVIGWMSGFLPAATVCLVGVGESVGASSEQRVVLETPVPGTTPEAYTCTLAGVHVSVCLWTSFS